MYWNRAGLKADGKEKFRRNYGNCVLVSLIVGLITGTGGSVRIERWLEDTTFALWFLIPGAVVILVQILVFSVLEMGACRFLCREQGLSGRGFQDPFWVSVRPLWKCSACNVSQKSVHIFVDAASDHSGDCKEL